MVDIAFKKPGKSLKMADKLRALELLGKHLGMFVKTIESSERQGYDVLLIPSPVDPESWAKAAQEYQAKIAREIDKENNGG